MGVQVMSVKECEWGIEMVSVRDKVGRSSTRSSVYTSGLYSLGIHWKKMD